MRRMNDFARGSSAPFARGFNTVYGWHDGESSQSSALSSARVVAVSDEMSAYDHERSCEVRYKATMTSDLLHDLRTMICGIYTTGRLVPVEGSYNGSLHFTLHEGAMQPAWQQPRL